MTTVLVIGGRADRARCATRHLEPRGYRLLRLPGLPLPAQLPDADVAILWLPGAAIGEVGAACARLRAEVGAMSLVLHAAEGPEEIARLLELGADDCLPATHNPREMVARVRALLRRRERNRRDPGPRMLADGCRFDPLMLAVEGADGRRVEITPLQNRLLGALAARPGEVVSREHLLAHVLGEDTDSFDRAIDVHVSRLKKRLARVGGGGLITAYRGIGYRLDAEGAAAG